MGSYLLLSIKVKSEKNRNKMYKIFFGGGERKKTLGHNDVY
jgi:hypothetical protein